MLTDSMIAEQLRRSSHEFRTVEEAHHRLDLELIDLQKRHVLTPAEEQSKKHLQKEFVAAMKKENEK